MAVHLGQVGPSGSDDSGRLREPARQRLTLTPPALSPDGHYEGVFMDGGLTSDQKNGGTYNYSFTPNGSLVQEHRAYDSRRTSILDLGKRSQRPNAPMESRIRAS
jgi:hypothetical protein